MSEQAQSRQERKAHTRRAILDAALDLSEDSGLGALSLRQVAKEVGIVPTAFYRHFESIDALGLALVEESFESLRRLLRDVRRRMTRLDQVIDTSVAVLVEHALERRGHFTFIARERMAGPGEVREAIHHQLELISRELATDIARLPGTDVWSSEDLQIVAELIVDQMVATAERVVTQPGHTDVITSRARTQLRMVIIGALNWRSRTSEQPPG